MDNFIERNSFLEEVTQHILTKFKLYLSENNKTQTEAANLLGISKGQLTHILNNERRLNHQIGTRMLDMMKNKMPITTGGIYGIFNNSNTCIYIGKTNNFQRRWNAHKTALRHYHSDDKSPFHYESGYLPEELSFEILADCTSSKLFPSELNRLEQLFITTIIPEWNTLYGNFTYQMNLYTMQEYKLNVKECWPSWIATFLDEALYYNYPITTKGYELLREALYYSNEDLTYKLNQIFSH